MDSTDGYWSTYATYRNHDSLAFGYPAGNYKLGFRIPSGTWMEVDYTASGDVPVGRNPVLTNYLELQELADGEGFTIEWETGDMLDEDIRVEAEIIHLRPDGIYPSVYSLSALDEEAPHPAEGFLSIPAGVLEPGGRYQLSLRFVRASAVEQSTHMGTDWTLYTSARLETVTELGFKSDAPLQPAYAWKTIFDLSWDTSGSAFLKPLTRFPVSHEVQFLFAPFDRTTIPAEQVSVAGPIGTGFESASGHYLLSDPDETLWYVIPSQSIEYPEPGNYSVGYRGKQFSTDQTSVPAAPVSPVAFPSAQLDAGNHLTGLHWKFRNPETGRVLQAADLQGITGQTVAVYAGDGSLIFLKQMDGSASEYLEFPEEVRVPWSEVSRITLTAWLESGKRALTQYRISHLETPLHIYFSEGTPVDGWLLVPWLGWVAEASWPWIWSQRHGYLYLAGDGNGQVYAWTPNLGWIYFNLITYPFYYAYSAASWSRF
jgi:hypothetical protein